MNSSLLLWGLILTQPAAEPPVVGRPTDWSGIVGGPYFVTLIAEPTELTAEDPLSLTVRIAAADGSSAGNLRTLKRPSLAKLDTFKAFAVEDLDDSFSENPPHRWFRYSLRPRSADVKEVPPVKFVYFHPRAGRYQTTYSDTVPLTIRPRATPLPTANVPAWIVREREEAEKEGKEALDRLLNRSPWQFEFWWDMLPSWLPFNSASADGNGPLAKALALITPPLFGIAWYTVWRRRNPDAARLATLRRSRASVVALHSLAQISEDSSGRVERVVHAYLHARAGLPQSTTTPPEVAAFLRSSADPASAVQSAEDLLRRCADARFSPAGSAPADLVAEAERLVFTWEHQS